MVSLLFSQASYPLSLSSSWYYQTINIPPPLLCSYCTLITITSPTQSLFDFIYFNSVCFAMGFLLFNDWIDASSYILLSKETYLRQNLFFGYKYHLSYCVWFLYSCRWVSMRVNIYSQIHVKLWQVRRRKKHNLVKRKFFWL